MVNASTNAIESCHGQLISTFLLGFSLSPQGSTLSSKLVSEQRKKATIKRSKKTQMLDLWLDIHRKVGIAKIVCHIQATTTSQVNRRKFKQTIHPNSEIYSIHVSFQKWCFRIFTNLTFSTPNTKIWHLLIAPKPRSKQMQLLRVITGTPPHQTPPNTQFHPATQVGLDFQILEWP